MVINSNNLNNQAPATNEEIKKLVEENLKLNKEMHQMLKSVKSFVFWQRIFGVLKILIIIVPLVLGVIYIPRIIQEVQSNPDKYIGNSWLTNYFENLFKSSVENIDVESIDVNKLPADAQKYFK